MRETFRLKFAGEHEMDAALLGQVLMDLSVVAKEIGKDSDRYDDCEIHVQAFQEGSFEIILGTVAIIAAQLNFLPPLGQIASMFSIYKGMFDLKKFLSGRKPDKELRPTEAGRLHLESPDGGVLDIPWPCNLAITNPDVDKCVSNVAVAAIQHNAGGTMNLIGDGEIGEYSASDLEKIASPLGTVEDTLEVQEWSVRVKLPIRKLDLIGHSQWSFDYNGRIINAAIEDAMFLAQVHSGLYAYRSGDSLDVTLQTRLTTSNDGTPTNERYSIIEVHTAD